MLSFIFSLAVRVLNYETICFLGPPLVFRFHYKNSIKVMLRKIVTRVMSFNDDLFLDIYES